MRAVIPVLLACLLTTTAAAQPLVATNRMTCAEASGLVRRQGDVTLNTGSGVAERLVRDRSFCQLTEIAELRFAPTRDHPQCPVGYRCREPDYEGWNWE